MRLTKISIPYNGKKKRFGELLRNISAASFTVFIKIILYLYLTNNVIHLI